MLESQKELHVSFVKHAYSQLFTMETDSLFDEHRFKVSIEKKPLRHCRLIVIKNFTGRNLHRELLVFF